MGRRSKKSRGKSADVSSTKETLATGNFWIWAALLVVLTIAAYQPVWFAGYIWDDDKLLTRNAVVVGPLGLTEIWTTKAADICPLTLSTFWLENKLWGLAPLPYHLVNVLLQASCAVVLWRVLTALRIPGAWLGAALWAIHPVQVESVAWISEMKNTESGLLYLLAIFFFVRNKQALMLLFAALAMMSKATTAVLPLVLVLCAWWMDGQFRLRALVKVAPVFLMAIGASALAVWNAANQRMAFDVKWDLTLPERLIVAGRVFWFYLEKLAWPYPLLTAYPRWEIDSAAMISWLPLLAAIGILVLVWIKRRAWGNGWAFALLYYVATLLPVFGLVNHFYMHYSFVADHLQYLAAMGPLALVGAGIARLAEKIPEPRVLVPGFAGVVLVLLGALSWMQSHVYQNEETLWTHTLKWNPLCWQGYNNLGIVRNKQNRVGEAIDDFTKALQIEPDYPEAMNNLGRAYLQKGRMDDAIAEFQHSLTLKADPLAEVGLGDALYMKGQTNEAIVHLQRAININPSYADAYFNLGTVLISGNRIDEAIACFQKAVTLSPQDAQARDSLNAALMKKGQPGK